ncbi:hypothetical protein CFC21_041876 [Triticum aestivum]|uniref:AB hydrolase-1 domain-containing protein n=3 Tax=Triticum TaxID=4564 RepID=A0A9R1QK16_TRITD|nr:uncharacterized protein LOC123070509 isoform X2 [Triticum aestivum]KAF7030310.1 hypothetical protein CFC21_041876 [Triticum aestivum]VAH78804.1 unnamed protein product [Triticum turgidum subsp. durum]
MPLLHGASLRALLAGAAVAHLSSSPIVRASPCAPPQPLRLRAFASHSASEPPPPPPSSPSPSTSRVLASAAAACDCEEGAKPAICTADELHYAPVPGTEWRLALWRYRPPPEAPKRNHPLMLLSGVATNAVGFDLSPGASFARHMSMQGFDTWIVELRGAGLSTRGSELAAASTKSDMSSNSDKFLGLMELPQTSAIYDQISQLSQRLVKILGEGQQNVSPRLFGWQERLSATIEDLQKQLELIISYDWDFDHYLEEDVPAAIDYIKQQSVPKDGKLLAIGHSMGGILLYAMVSKCGFEGADPELAAIVTLASSVDYTTSNSSLKLFVPLADPAEMLRVPAVPLGTLLSTTYPISSRAPYILSLLRSQISAKDMMDPELLSKLILNNFCTVPAKVLLQLATSFRDGGLRNRAGTFFFKEHLRKIKVPVLALAGDEDLICPPEAVYETVKVIPQHLVTYKVFGKPEGPHYAHYDLVGGRKAVHEVYPCIIEFLSQHDDVSS